MNDRIDAAWSALRQCLESRARELDQDVRSYPTPIARCDEQLTRAIELRDAAFRQIRFAGELDRLRAAGAHEQWLAHVREFVSRLGSIDDEAVAATREQIGAVLELR